MLGQDPSELGGTLSLSTPATAASHVQAGGYPITPGGLTSTNYAITFVNGTLTITPAPLTITADDQSMVYGASLPGLTASYSGFVNGDTSANLTTPVTLSTAATPSSPVGTYAIQASGAASADYLITFGDGTLPINQASTTTALVSSANPSVFGQSLTFTATVGAVAPGSGTPTGSVTFMDGSTSLGTIALSSGVATFSTTSLSVATHSITAVYGGDGNFTTSTSSAVSQAVNQASTTTSLTASPTSTTSGQTVTLTATMAVVAPGAGTPTGSVQFFIGTTSLGTADPSGNTAILTTTTLPVGTDSLTAQYLGDPNFTGSTSSAVTVTINPAGIATTTTLTSSTNPSVFGQSVTFTATVAPSSGSGTPTGSVTFYAGPTPLGTATPQQQEGIPQNDVGARRFAGDHRGLQRGHHLCSRHVRGPHSDGEPGLDNDQSDVFGEPVGLWTVSHAHGNREGGLAGKWHSDRHGDVLRRHDESRQRHSQRWDGHSFANILRRRLSLDHGSLQRRPRLHRQHLAGTLSNGQQGWHHDSGRFCREPVDLMGSS